LRKIYYRKIPTSSLCMYFSKKCTQSLLQMLLSLLSQSYGDRILGRNSDKSFKSFLRYSQSPLQLCPEISISTKSRNLLCISSNSRNLLCISTEKLLYKGKAERRKICVRKSIQIPQFLKLSRLCPETSTSNLNLKPQPQPQLYVGHLDIRFYKTVLPMQFVNSPFLKWH
jgi:hypothetical protein